jgi:streptogramin lyase
LLIADLANARVRRIDLKSGVVETIAGNGKRGLPANGGKALESPLSGPRAVTATANGVVYIVLREGHALVELKDGLLRTVVNQSGKAGAQGDGGTAVQAQLNGPKYLALDPAGGLLIVDTENHAIRRFDPSAGTLTTVAGLLGKPGHAVGKLLTQTELKRPHGIRIDRQGRWWIADSENDRIIWATP